MNDGEIVAASTPVSRFFSCSGCGSSWSGSWRATSRARSTGASATVPTAPGVVYHRICDDKSASTFVALMKGYRGWVVCDALGTHEAGARACPGLRLAGCWAHVLRRFRDAVADFPDAQVMLAWIGDLYRIDERAGDQATKRGGRSPADGREVYR